LKRTRIGETNYQDLLVVVDIQVKVMNFYVKKMKRPCGARFVEPLDGFGINPVNTN